MRLFKVYNAETELKYIDETSETKKWTGLKRNPSQWLKVSFQKNVFPSKYEKGLARNIELAI